MTTTKKPARPNPAPRTRAKAKAVTSVKAWAVLTLRDKINRDDLWHTRKGAQASADLHHPSGCIIPVRIVPIAGSRR